MRETPAELAELDALLERSFAGAGPHLTEIIAPSRRLSAEELCAYLEGVRHFVVATTTASGEPRCSAVDTLMLHGRLWFTTSATSVKARHLAARPAVSLAHVVGDDVGVFVHGRARLVQGATDEAAGLAPEWHAVYGSTPEDWVDAPEHARYVEVLAHACYTYAFDRERFAALLAQRHEP